MFLGTRGQKGAPVRTRPYSCTWMHYSFGLLLLLNYYVFVLIKIGSWVVWKNTRKIAILVFLDLKSEFSVQVVIFFCHENENKKNDLNPQFALFCNTVGLIQESNRVMDKNRVNRFFSCFPFIFDWDPVDSRKRLHHFVILFWKVYSLSNRSAAAPVGIRSRATARVMVPSILK